MQSRNDSHCHGVWVPVGVAGADAARTSHVESHWHDVAMRGRGAKLTLASFGMSMGALEVSYV